MNRSLITIFVAGVALFGCATSRVSAAIDLKGYDGRPTANPAYFFDVQQTSAKWGEVIGIRLAVINTGTTASGTFSVRLYFSKNTTFGDADDVSFVTVPGFPSLGQNQLTGYTSYANVSLPGSNPYGDSSTVFYIGMMVDPNNAIAESNETNNRNFANGTDKDGTPITITGPAPKIQLATSGSTLPPATSLAMNFGNLAADGAGGATLTQTVQLTNTGDLALSDTGIAVSGAGFSIKDITSNIQTLTQPVTYPRAITALGQETWLINVLFDPTTTGSRTGALVVSSNDATRPSVSISLQGNGIAVPQMVVGYGAPVGTDTRSMDFGTVINDGAGAAKAERTITLTNSGSGPLTVSQNGLSLINGTGWQIVSTTSSTQGAISLTSSAKTIAASNAETWSIVVRFDPASVGTFSGGLQILSNDPNSPSYALALSGTAVVPMMLEVKDSIGADSNRAMNFGAVHADGAGLQQALGSVTLKNTGGAPLVISQNGIAMVDGTHFKILSITSTTQPGLNLATGTATLATGSGEIWTVNLACDPAAAGVLATQLRILSNDPAQGTVTIALSGTGLTQPGVEAADSSGAAGDRAIAFGPTLNDGAGNRTRSHSVTLKNIGAQPLVISQNGVSIINGAKFSVQSIVSSTRGAISISSATAAARTIAAIGAEIWTITLAFDPDANAAFTATLRITGNDPLLPTLDHSLSGSGVQPAIALHPTSPASTLFISASQPHLITWTATYTGGDARISLFRDTDTNPANGNTLIVSNLLQSAGSTYAWQPDPALAGQEFHIYATIEDGTVKTGSYAARKIRIDAVGAFQLISAVQSASTDYAWQYEYLGKLYTGNATLIPGQNLITVTTPLAGGGNATHQFTVTKAASLLQSEAYTYDEMQRIKTFRNGNGITTTYTYDLAGRLEKTEATNGARVSFTYDTLSRRVSMTDSTGTTFYDYDDLDRLTKVIVSDNATKGDADDLPLQYGYNLAGHITSMTYPGGEQTTYTFDDAGRMKTAGNVALGSTATYTYHPTSGLLQNAARSNGLRTDYAYNNMGRLNRITHVRTTGAVTTLGDYNYTLNPAGNATELVITLPSGVKRESYQYDGLDRLEKVTYSTGTGTDPSAKVVSYTYSAAGNRLTERIETGGSLQKLWTYTYGSENRLLFIKDHIGTEVRRYVYDAAGNRIQKVTPEATTFYTYDERNLLTSVRTATDTIKYFYNGIGHRVGKTLNGVTTRFIIDPNRQIYETVQERGPSGITESYTYGLDRLIRKLTTAAAQFYLHDRLGSVRLLADPAANVTETLEYDAFGAQQ